MLALALIVNAVAMLVPYWKELETGNQQIGEGLWGRCTCSWFLTDIVDYFQSGQDYMKAVQALYAIAVAFIILAVLILMCSSCCREKQGGTGILVAGVFLIISFALIAASVIVYGIFANRDVGNPGLTGNPRLGWGMWLGVAGAVLCLLAGIMHIHWGRRRD